MRTKGLTLVLVMLVGVLSTFGQARKPISKQGLVKAVKVGGLSYQDVGNPKAKSAIVFIHGWACNAYFWKDSVRAFPATRVIAVDLPGHGASDRPRVTYSMEYFARSIDTVMKHAGVEKAVLVGHSMGTPVARQFYRIFPDKTLAIVSVDGTLKSIFTKEATEQFFAPLFTNYTENAPKFVDGMLEPIKDVSLKKMIRESMLSTPDYVAISAMQGMIDERIWTDDKINVPVMAIMAPAPFWPKDLKEQYSAVAPNIEFQMWAGVSHFLHMEKPAEFNQQLKGFISQNKLL